MTCYRAEQETTMVLREPSAAAGAQDIAEVEFRLADGASGLQSLWPFGFDRRDREKQRSRKISFAADAGLLKGFFGCDRGHLFGEADRRERFDGNEIHRSALRRFQAICRKG